MSGGSKIFKTIFVLFILTTLVFIGLYFHQQSINSTLNDQVRLLQGGLTAANLSPSLAKQISNDSQIAGAFPTSTTGLNNSCSNGQVLSFTNGKIVCVSLQTGNNGQIVVTDIGPPSPKGSTNIGNNSTNGINGTSKSNGNNRLNNHNGIIGAIGPQGPRGNAGPIGLMGPQGSPGILATTFGNGLSGGVASQVLNLNLVTSSNGGISNTANGLTLITSCNKGQSLKWNGSSWVCSNNAVASGNLISLTPGITISNGNGAVLGAGTSISIATASATNTGLLNSVDWNTFNNKQAALTFNGSGLFNELGNTVSAVTCSANQITVYNGATWICSNQETVPTYTAGVGFNLSGTTFNFDPAGFTTVSSVAGTDQILLYNGSTSEKITYNDLFSGVLGSMNYQGTWNANTNTPNLTNVCSTSTKGYYYVVNTAGTTTLGSISSWNIGDWAVCNGSNWQQIQSTNAVSSVFGRTGTITAQSGDYNASQITNTPDTTSGGSISATDVQTALNQLDTNKLTSTLNTGLIFVGNSSNMATPTALSGDVTLAANGAVTISNSVITAAMIANGTLTFANLASNGCVSGQVVEYNGSAWVCGTMTPMTTVSASSTGVNVNLPIEVTSSGSSYTVGFNPATTVGQYWAWDGSEWSLTTPATLAIGTLDSQTPSSNGAVLANSTLYLQSASATEPGLINDTTQIFAGDKTFTGNTTETGNFNQTGSGSFSTGSGAVNLNGNTYLAANNILTAIAGTGGFDFSNASGIFKTTTGTNALEGNTIVAGSKTFTTGTGLTTVSGELNIVGSTLLSSVSVGNLGSGGNIISSLDATSYLVDQTTSGQTLTLPAGTTGQTVIVSNTGTAIFTIYGINVAPGNSIMFMWNGSLWSVTTSPSNNCVIDSSYVCAGGNALGSALTIGTTNSSPLNFETNGYNAFQISSGQSTLIGQGVTTIETTGDTLNIGGNGALNINAGPSNNLDIANNGTEFIYFGNNLTPLSTTAMYIIDSTGTGGYTNTSAAITTTGASFNENDITSGIGLQVNSNSLSTGTGLAVDSSSATSGAANLVNFDQSSINSNGTTLNLGSSGLGLAMEISSGALAINAGADFTTTGIINNAALDVAGENSSYIRFNGASQQILTGIAGGSNGKFLIITNAGTYPLIIDNMNSGSSTINQITTGTDANLSISSGGSISLIYDSTANVWRVIAASSGLSADVQTFTSSGTYTPTPGVKYIEIKAVGGGGAGGGTLATSANQIALGWGGGGGSYADMICTAQEIGSSAVTVSIGSGGSAVSGANGNNGGNTTFGSFLTVPGGRGGAVGTNFPYTTSTNSNLPSPMPTVSGCTLQDGAPGQDGNPGYAIYNPNLTEQLNMITAAGGNSYFGTGAQSFQQLNPTFVSQTFAPNNAVGYGSGGGGAAAVDGAAASAGSPGMGGFLEVTEYFN